MTKKNSPEIGTPVETNAPTAARPLAEIENRAGSESLNRDDASARGSRMAGKARGANASSKLTFQMDHSVGAGHGDFFVDA